MDKEKIISAMGYLDPTLVGEAEAHLRPRRSVGKMALVAACLCLALAGTALAVGAALYENFFTLEGQDAYYSVYTDSRMPLSAFASHIPELADSQGDGFMENMYLFDSWQAAEDFVGVDVMRNPLLEDAPIRPTFCADENGENETKYNCAVRLATSGETGNLLSVDVETSLWVSPNGERGMEPGDQGGWLQIMARMITEMNPYENGGGVGFPLDDLASLSREEYMTASDRKAIITANACPDPDSGREPFYRYVAYLEVNGVFFALETGGASHGGLGPEGLKQVLDAFS